MDNSEVGSDVFKENQNNSKKMNFEEFLGYIVTDVVNKIQEKLIAIIFDNKKKCNCPDEIFEFVMNLSRGCLPVTCKDEETTEKKVEAITPQIEIPSNKSCGYLPVSCKDEETTEKKVEAITQQIEIPNKNNNKQVKSKDDIKETCYFEYDKDARENAAKTSANILFLKDLEKCKDHDDDVKETSLCTTNSGIVENSGEEQKSVVEDSKKVTFEKESLCESELFYISEIGNELKRFKEVFNTMKITSNDFMECYKSLHMMELKESCSVKKYYEKLNEAICDAKPVYHYLVKLVNALNWLLQVKNKTTLDPSSESFTHETFLYYERKRFIEGVAFFHVATHNQYKYLLRFGKFVKDRLHIELMSDTDLKSDWNAIFMSGSNRLRCFRSSYIPGYIAAVDSLLIMMNMFIKTYDAAALNQK